MLPIAIFTALLPLASISFLSRASLTSQKPGKLAKKILARLGLWSDSATPKNGLAPYHRLQASHDLHRPLLLNLETSDGSGQACHPDVAYIPEGFGKHKWTYWMACTPYPSGNGRLENPEIFVSRDGITWAIPQGLRNPLVPPPEHVGDHHSDPDLVFFADQLWLFYRLTLRSKSPGTAPRENKIYLMKSTDGVCWSPPVEVLSERSGAELLSPAVVHDGTQFVMWTVEILDGHPKLTRRSSLDGLTWSPPTIASIVGLEPGRLPWHIDVIRENDRLSAILVSCTALGGRGTRIHYAKSVDKGLSWNVGDFLFEQVYEFESNLQYRATLRAIPGPNRLYELWYSAASSLTTWSIAYLKATCKEDKLIPWIAPEME